MTRANTKFRWAVLLAGVLASVPIGPQALAAAPGETASERVVVVLRVCVREADGTILRAPSQAVKPDETAAFSIESPNHKRQITVRVTAEREVDLDYRVDGKPVATEPADLKSGRQRFNAADGTEIAVALTNTRVRVETQPG
jgi:hypothetical protein